MFKCEYGLKQARGANCRLFNEYGNFVCSYTIKVLGCNNVAY